jgi:predicted NAD/FAD-binding protein
MPKRRTAWSAWNYLTYSESPTNPVNPAAGALQKVSLTYNMNILQSLSPATYDDILVTLNPRKPPAASLTQATYEYRHPLYNARMVAAQEKLEHIQGKRGIWYAGAWTGYGFHEDGFTSGMDVGLRLGGSVPWEAKDSKYSRGTYPILGWKDYVVRVVMLILQLFISILERFVGIKRGKRKNGDGQIRVNGVSNAKVKAS